MMMMMMFLGMVLVMIHYIYIDDDDDDDGSHQVGLPSTGITVFGSQLHTHGTGRKVGRHLIDHH